MEENSNPAAESEAEHRDYLMKAGRLLVSLFILMIAAASGYMVLILASQTDFTVGPVHAEFELKPAWYGKSIVDLPPAGTIEADTHSGPAIARYSLKEIAVTEVSELTDPESPSRQALQDWQGPVRSQVRSLLMRILILSALTGGAICALIKRRWQWGIAGALTAMLTAALVAGMVWQTYDMEAFREPRYSGSLTYAPDVVAFSEETLANLDDYETRVPEIAASLYRTISQLHQLPGALSDGDTIRIVHVSDMHRSAAAAKLVRQTVDLYQADFVVDTGDLTDLGTPFEAGYPSTYLPLPKPYLWIGGNHDSPTITTTMRGLAGVTVLESQYTDISGVIIGGFPDPASVNLSPNPLSDAILANDAARILKSVESQDPRPFIVAVHDPKQAALLPGRVPVVLNGHTHREGITVKDGTVFLDAGTTGGGGFRSFSGSAESPNSLQVLYITKNPLKLVAVDSISIYGFSQEFSVTRHVFTKDEGVFGPLEASLALPLL
ncbi:MAG: metallophosphoesterase [Thermoleophilia bacterium]